MYIVLVTLSIQAIGLSWQNNFSGAFTSDAW